MKRRLIVPFLNASFLSLLSCSSTDPTPPQPIIDPIAYVEFACPQEDNIYKIWPDTILLNNKGEFYGKLEENIFELKYEYAEFVLGTCEGKLDLRNKAINSPLAWSVKADAGGKSENIPTRSGVLYIKEVLLQQDIDRILKFKGEEEVDFKVALLNFNRDTIQSSTIKLIYKPDFKKEE
ncbi:hypothetical protein [Sphingobacterium gobiense]|uniref:Lipoprotein n=1 Tax=Sphingobacterium gobiense TaxID=1382456 RepID=A0A2S9JI86_9SPHI|nr:hypothetical protein [Sphingobacterium gobiense]PRD52720.1 hypothetical protein C5749_15990 [Sphingobacterium gobiense]